MFDLTRNSRLVILGVAIPTTAALLYWLLKTSFEDEEEDNQQKKKVSVTSRQTVIEMEVPRSAVGQIIGRQGATIKELQEKSGARINFKDNSVGDSNRTIIIRGTSEAAQTAECLIRKLLSEIPVMVQEEIQVPSYAIGRIIGRGGDSVRSISSVSKAKVYVDRSPGIRDKPHKITLHGSEDQIEMAKSLIQEKVDEEEEFRARAAVSAANREAQKKAKGAKQSSPDIQSNGSLGTQEWKTEVREQDQTHCRRAKFPPNNDYQDVYVSAIAHPGHFWVQVVNSMALQLDQLSEQMTRFYDMNAKDMQVSEVQVGDIVAAPFENDNTWYRAEVMGVDGQEVDLFYVDYGDSAYIDRSQVCQLSHEYLALPFQAIECRLAGVQPIGEWSESAFEKFEELTYCAKWKVVVAKAEKFSGDKPHLLLFDTNGEQDININNEMVRLGFGQIETDP